MWARVIECMIAIWLSLSPFIFHHPSEKTFLWINDFICACLVIFFSLLSFWHPLRKVHLLTIAIALWLWSLGYTNFPDQPSTASQNCVIVGLLLLMLAIIPNHADLPTFSWTNFLKRK